MSLKNFGNVIISSTLLLLAFLSITIAKFPNTFPYRDECYGLAREICRPMEDKGNCKFHRDQYPECFDRDYANLRQKRKEVSVGAASLYFTFSAGVHLSEGTHQKTFVNLSPDECAQECLRSALICPYNIRCLSFDFYPYESPKTGNPWRESYDTGICVLNNENKDSARLRNSDLGYSDASLYYRSHFSYLPFADTEGYYEVRDPRGGELQWLLDYGVKTSHLPATNNVWGGSRWGFYHFQVPPILPAGEVAECPFVGAPPPFDDFLPTYDGGYTPLDEDQKCPGLVSYEKAEFYCARTGGRLCEKFELDKLVGVKIGCGFDGPVRGNSNLYPEEIWELGKKGKQGEKKFARCCAAYSFLDSCKAYTDDNAYKKCSKYKTATDCVLQASGTRKQFEYGMGIYLDEIRRNCTRDNTKCKGMIQEWTARDECVWCPKEGALTGGGAGDCRVGSSLAICENSPPLLRNMWRYLIKTHKNCQPGGETVCKLIENYPDLARDLLDQPRNGTMAPTMKYPEPGCRGISGGIPGSRPTSSSPTVTGGDIDPSETAPCYTLKNVPAICNGRNDCQYDFIRKRCMKKA